jgi:hypothetical protein
MKLLLQMAESLSGEKLSHSFNVVHSVTGEENQPLNTWKIIHVTKGVDPSLTAGLQKHAAKGDLNTYIVVYI